MHVHITRSVRRRVAPIALFALGALAACSNGTAGASGKISLLLTDATGDVKTAVVTISEIDLMGSGGQLVLMNTPVTTDLLTLANTTASLVQDATVPAGTYAQLRFVITGGYIEVDNGDGTTSIYASSPSYEGLPQGAHVDGTLQMPSYLESGLKVDLPGGAVTIDGNEKIVLVDFDVSQSFGVQAGTSGDWAMHPVIKATDFQTTGGITVTAQLGQGVTLPTLNNTAVTLGDFSATIDDGNGGTKTLALTDTNGDGVFEATFELLAPGTYSVDLTAPTGMSFTTDPAHPTTVTLSSGQPATTNFTITAATTP